MIRRVTDFEQPLESRQVHCETSNREGRSVGMIGALFVSIASVAGSGIGLSWRNDSLAAVGIVGLGLFLVALWHLKSLLGTAIVALLTGYLAFLIANPWMQWTIEGMMETSVIKATIVVHGVHLLHAGTYLLFALAWWLIRRLSHDPNSIWHWVSVPAIWLIVEAFYPAMFPMRHGCLLLAAQPLVQIASVFGVSGATVQTIGISLLIPFLVLVFSPVTKRPDQVKYAFAIAGILLFTAINGCWGLFRIDQMPQSGLANEMLKIGIVQGDTEFSTAHLEFVKRSRRLASECDLLLWPECSLGKYHRDLNDFSNDSNVAMHSMGIGFQFRPLSDPECHLLAGGYSWDGNAKEMLPTSRYVSAFLLDQDEKLIGRHDKVELMAGGEYVPGQNWFPVLAEWLTADEDELGSVPLSRGSSIKPIGTVKGMSVATLLCCEDMYPYLSRKMAIAGADLIVCLANGMAFDSEIALRQHLNISRFRAIENNRYFARCGSYGVSCLISPTGEVLQSADCFEETELSLQVPVAKRTTTIFSKYGDSLLLISVLWLVGFVFCIRAGRDKPLV